MSDSSVLHAVAGAGAGCASLAITYPLYARMVRQQVQGASSAESAESSQPQSIVQQLAYAVSRESLESNFAGLPAALWAITVQSAVYYYFFQAFKNVHGVSTSPLGNMFVGTEAGIATVMLTNPLWVINSRQITQRSEKVSAPVPAAEDALSTHVSGSLKRRTARTASSEPLGLLVAPHADALTRRSPSPLPESGSDPLLDQPFPSPSASPSSAASALSPSSASLVAPAASPAAAPQSLVGAGFFESFRLLVVHEGLSGVYSGVGPALALVSSPALQFASYEYLKALLLRLRHSHARAAGSSLLPVLSSLDFFFLGAVSKIIATLLTYPIQTLKSQLQKANSPYSNDGLRGSLRCISDMASSPEGISSFYRGLRAKILQTGLTAAFLFVIRERLIRWLSLWAAAAPKIVK